MDMVTFLRSRNIEVATAESARRDKHVAPGWAQMRCPICGGNKLWLGYSFTGHYFNCYNHGFASKWQLFRAWFPAEDIRCLLTLADDAIEIPKNIPTVVGQYLPPPQQHSLLSSRRHCTYVLGRGFSPECLENQWGVTALDYDTEWRYRGRLFFPVCDNNSLAVSWLTRTIDPDNPYRYLTAPKEREATPIKSLLYGEQFVSSFDTVIVCEGVFDAIRVGRNAVATLGKKITPIQFDKIAKFQRRLICFDSERDTQEQAKELAVKLQAFPGLTDNVCLDAPDPATASQKEINALLKFAELL